MKMDVISVWIAIIGASSAFWFGVTQLLRVLW